MDKVITLNTTVLGTTNIIEYIIANNYPLLDSVAFKNIRGYTLMCSSTEVHPYYLEHDEFWHTLEYLRPHKVRRLYNGHAWFCDVNNHYYIITN